MNLLKLSWKNILHKPLSSLLSILLFALGIGLIVLLLLFERQLKDNFDKNLAGIDLVIGAKGSPLQLILNSMYHVDAPTGNIALSECKALLNPKHPLIETAIPLALGDSYRGYRIVGTTDQILALYGAKVGSGRIWVGHFEVTIGYLVAKRVGLKIGDEFLSTHGLDENPDLEHDHNENFKVVGILEPSGAVVDQLILTTPQTIWAVHGHEESVASGTSSEEHEHEEGEDHEDHNHGDELKPVTNMDLTEFPDEDITSILIKFKSKTNFQSLSMLRNINQNTNMMAASPPIEINRLYSMIGSGTDAMRGIAIVIAIVSALSIFISLFNSLRDRRYELALMRVSGGTRTDIFSLIIFEGLLLALLGCLLGFIVGHFGMGLFSGLMSQSYNYDFTGMRFLRIEYLVLAIGLLIGILAAILPAWQASRTDIHKTLSAKG